MGANGIPLHGELCQKGTKVLLVDSDPRVAAIVGRFLERVEGNFDIEVAEFSRTGQLRAANAEEQAVWIELINQIVAKAHQNPMRQKRRKRGVER